MKVEVENYPKVSLGCGTLILIALIVLMFSKGPDYETRQNIERLNNRMIQIQQEIRELNNSINELKEMIRKK